jgi:hypothetical protein
MESLNGLSCLKATVKENQELFASKVNTFGRNIQ